MTVSPDPSTSKSHEAESCRKFAGGDADTYADARKWAEYIILVKYNVPRDAGSDLVDETLSQVFQKTREPAFRIQKSFKAFVLHVAKMRVIEHWRKEYNTIITYPGDSDSDTSTVQPTAVNEVITEAYRRELIAKTLGELSLICRKTLTNIFLEQRTYAETARTMDKPIGTVRANIFRCLRLARVILTSRLGADDITFKDLWGATES